MKQEVREFNDAFKAYMSIIVKYAIYIVNFESWLNDFVYGCIILRILCNF